MFDHDVNSTKEVRETLFAQCRIKECIRVDLTLFYCMQQCAGDVEHAQVCTTCEVHSQ